MQPFAGDRACQVSKVEFKVSTVSLTLCGHRACRVLKRGRGEMQVSLSKCVTVIKIEGGGRQAVQPSWKTEVSVCLSLKTEVDVAKVCSCRPKPRCMLPKCVIVVENCVVVIVPRWKLRRCATVVGPHCGIGPLQPELNSRVKLWLLVFQFLCFVAWGTCYP